MTNDLPVRLIRQALLKKGFIETREGDHIHFVLSLDQRRIPIQTFYSHGARSVNAHLQSAMARQLRLTRALFSDLVECRLDQAGYVRLLRESGII